MANKTLSYEETEEEILLRIFIQRNQQNGGNIYQIASCIQVLSSRGKKEYHLKEYHLTDEERERLYSAFMKCRQGKNILPELLEHGYQLARMFILVRHFFPALNQMPSEEEKGEFLKTAKLLAEKGDFFQLASFLETCASLGVDASVTLTEEEMEKVANETAVSS